MAKAAEELCKSSLGPEYTEETTVDVDVSLDGTCQSVAMFP